jgi:hypothetical protein
MPNAHITSAAQIIANAIAQLDAINANAQGISERAFDLDDTTDVDTIRAARQALRVIEASGAIETLQVINSNLHVTAL